MSARLDPVLADYVDALLADAAPVPSAHESAAPEWLALRHGRLGLVLEARTIGEPRMIDIAAPPAHGAHVALDGTPCLVIDLFGTIAPHLAGVPPVCLVRVRNTHAAFALPALPEPIALARAAIEWRGERSSRPWLAGMAGDGQHIVVDARALVESIDTGVAPEGSPT